MPTYPAADGTVLHYSRVGPSSTSPVIVLGGGPMQDSAYLGDLGGLAAGLDLAIVDFRGTGASSQPADPGTYRCDHLVEDVEALRHDLVGTDERVDLLAHSAGANVAGLYAARYPHRIRRLALITPSTYAVGIDVTSADRRQMVALRAGEPWFATAADAFEAIQSGSGAEADWAALTPFSYGRWDETARAHHARGERQGHPEAAAIFGSHGAYDPPATRAILATISAPVLLLAGALDVGAPPRVVAQFAELFRDATLATQPNAGHFPWLDDPARFSAALNAFFA